jgi:DNA-binding IclR family transcriptional regulator
MARRAPAVERSIAILNLLAAHPDQRYSLSEMARDLSLNKATLHAILWSLTEAGYLVRDEGSKAYALGPALIALGNSALETFPAAHAAVPEMEALTAELGLDCVASAAIRGEIVILARSGAPGPFGIDVQPGQRVPLTPPLGTVFVAWSGPEEIDRWLASVGPSVPRGKLERYREGVREVRARGYSIGLARGEYRRLVEALRRADHEATERPTLEEGVKGLRTDEYALIELDRAESYRLNHIGAPVFGPGGEVTLALFLIGFQDQIPAEQVPKYADRLLEACAKVTRAIKGREPDDAE